MKKLKREKKKQKIVRVCSILLRNVPTHIREEFKAFTARRGMTMTSRLIELMQQDSNSDIKSLSKSKPIRKTKGNKYDNEDE